MMLQNAQKMTTNRGHDGYAVTESKVKAVQERIEKSALATSWELRKSARKRDKLQHCDVILNILKKLTSSDLIHNYCKTKI